MDSDAPPSAPSAPLLTFEESRVLGALIEKEQTTPEYYPQSLNQVVAACNQSNNRDPVVALGERAVENALQGLKAKGLAYQLTLAGARVQKFKHHLEGKFPRLEKPTVALLCVLLLRGQQTLGELRQRTERIYAFPDLAAVEASLKDLIEYPEYPLAVLMPPGGGRKTSTYAHLLCGPPEIAALTATPDFRFTAPASAGDPEWKERIEGEVATLRAEVAQLRELLEG